MSSFFSGRRMYATFFLLLICILLILLLFSGQSAKIWHRQWLKPSNERPSVHYDDNSSMVPSWNQPTKQHIAEATQLFIGFTRNWSVLQQAVVSYISAGWPPLDIYIVDNTGTMQSNALNQLTPENPFYLDHDYLTRILGVNVLTTPTYLSFAQLQNFYLYTSITNHWPHYFWSHMDVAALTDEVYEPFASLYNRAADALRETMADPAWGMRFFAYDYLTLANTAAYMAVGGFDTFIPYYTTDCDFHFRISQAGYTIRDAHAGHIYDVGESLADLSLFFRQNTTEARATCEPDDIDAAAAAAVADVLVDAKAYGRGDCRFHALRRMLETIDHKKQTHKGGRNFWQASQIGGQGEPFWQYPEGFEKAVLMQSEHGKKVFEKKWGHSGCDLVEAGRSCKNSATCSAWRVDEEKDG